MGGMFRALMNLPMFKSVLRPITRVLVAVIAIPIFRFFMRKIFRLQDLDDELEKDLEQWFRGALMLLAASANMEHLLFGWMAKLDWLDNADWLTMGLRLMLAIGVIEAMPDQELFAVIHPGPPKIKPGKSVLKEFWKKKWLFLKGFVCQHLNRSSPVLAMMTAIVGAQLITPSVEAPTAMEFTVGQVSVSTTPLEAVNAWAVHNASLRDAQQFYLQLPQTDTDLKRDWERWVVGWVCYLMAITQYLIIGLVTSRDRAMDVLSEFDRAVAERRRELIEEFDIDKPTDVEKESADDSASEAQESHAAEQPPPPSPENAPDSGDNDGPLAEQPNSPSGDDDRSAAPKA